MVSLEYIILSDMKQHMVPGAVADMKKLCADFWIVQMSIFVCCFKEMSVCNDKVY